MSLLYLVCICFSCNGLCLLCDNTSTNSILVRSGKSGWFSSFGPIAGKFTSFISSMKTTKCGFHIQTNVLLYSFPSTVIICLELASRGRSMSTVTSSTSSFSVCSFRTWGALGCLRIYSHYLLPASLWTWLLLPFCL